MSEGGSNTEGAFPRFAALRSIFKSPFGRKQEAPPAPALQEPPRRLNPTVAHGRLYESVKVEPGDFVDATTMLEQETIEVEQALEKQEDEIEQDELLTEPVVEPETRQLRRANKIFFHTTPSQNVASIRREGLHGKDTTESLGKDLWYSLTFGSEYNAKEVRRPTTSFGPLTDFSLTIWKQSLDIKQTREHFTGKINKYGGYSPAGERIGEVSVQYELSGGSYGRPIPDSASAKRVDPSNMLASIRITEELALDLTKIKLDFINNQTNADNSETQLVKMLERSEGLELGENYSIQDLSHDLMSRIEQEVIQHQARLVADDTLARIAGFDSADPNADRNGEWIQQNLYDLRSKKGMVNEPVTYRYLDARQRYIERMLKKKGAEGLSADPTRIKKPAVSYGLYEMWGCTKGAELAAAVEDNKKDLVGILT